MGQHDIEIAPINILMKAASYFLAGAFFLYTLNENKEMSQYIPKDWIVYIAGLVVCAFGVLLVIISISVTNNEKWSRFRKNVDFYANQHLYVVFSAVVLSVMAYVLDPDSSLSLKIPSIVFLVIFLIVFIVAQILKSGVFSNIKSSSLFTISMGLFSIILVLTEDIGQWGVLAMLTIIMLSSFRIWYLARGN